MFMAEIVMLFHIHGPLPHFSTDGLYFLSSFKDCGSLLGHCKIFNKESSGSLCTSLYHKPVMLSVPYVNSLFFTVLWLKESRTVV
jgi:hypothetical protein